MAVCLNDRNIWLLVLVHWLAALFTRISELSPAHSKLYLAPSVLVISYADVVDYSCNPKTFNFTCSTHILPTCIFLLLFIFSFNYQRDAFLMPHYYNDFGDNAHIAHQRADMFGSKEALSWTAVQLFHLDSVQLCYMRIPLACCNVLLLQRWRVVTFVKWKNAD